MEIHEVPRSGHHAKSYGEESTGHELAQVPTALALVLAQVHPQAIRRAISGRIQAHSGEVNRLVAHMGGRVGNMDPSEAPVH